MSSAGFEMEGLEELQRDVEKVLREYPEEVSKKTYSLAGEFTKDVNAKFPSAYSTGKGSLSKSWKREREKTAFTGYTASVNVRNTAPHFHLVENGHEGVVPENGYAAHQNRGNKALKGDTKNKRPGRQKRDKKRMKSIGFVPGKHYCETTRNEWKSKLPQKVEKFVSKMLENRNL